MRRGTGPRARRGRHECAELAAGRARLERRAPEGYEDPSEHSHSPVSARMHRPPPWRVSRMVGLQDSERRSLPSRTWVLGVDQPLAHSGERWCAATDRTACRSRTQRSRLAPPLSRRLCCATRQRAQQRAPLSAARGDRRSSSGRLWTYDARRPRLGAQPPERAGAEQSRRELDIDALIGSAVGGTRARSRDRPGVGMRAACRFRSWHQRT